MSSSPKPSKIWCSPIAPSVVVAKAWVCPLVKTADPWVLGSKSM